MEDLVRLAADLVAADTQNPPGNERSAADLVADWLIARGVDDIEIKELSPGRANLIATVSAGAGPRLLLSGHLDTVVAEPTEWTWPISGAVEGDRLYGLGACDMKGAIAAMACAVAAIAADRDTLHGDLVLALTAGEETDSAGAERLVEHPALTGVDAIVVGEPTDLDIGVSHKGALWLQLHTVGRSTHSSAPVPEDNAIVRMLEWLSDAGFSDGAFASGADDDWLGAATVSINMIDAGTNYNVVPGSCTAVVDIRTVPGQDHGDLVHRVRQVAKDTEVRVLRDARPVTTPADDPFIGLVRDCVAAQTTVAPRLLGLPYVTDAGVFRRWSDAPIAIVGPGRLELAHVADEHVETGRLAQSAAVYEAIARRVLAIDGDWAVSGARRQPVSRSAEASSNSGRTQ